jgi:hypothetical protein
MDGYINRCEDNHLGLRVVDRLCEVDGGVVSLGQALAAAEQGGDLFLLEKVLL